MTFVHIDGLPELAAADSALAMGTSNTDAYIFSRYFTAAVDLLDARVRWIIERVLPQYNPDVLISPRYIQVSGLNVWLEAAGRIVVEISSTEHGELLVSARNTSSGGVLWERVLPVPEAASWAEKEPAWRGAQTEKINAFIAANDEHLVVCLFRESRRSKYYSPSEGIAVDGLPPYNCQTDAVRFDPFTGNIAWRKSYESLYLGILERKSFSGVWTKDGRIGVLNLEDGGTRVLRECGGILSRPTRIASGYVVSWHDRRDVRLEWLDEWGSLRQSWVTREPGIRITLLHDTGHGLALQLNDQSLCWFGDRQAPLWRIRAKPYIYRVFRGRNTDVFVGTDGGGGRLLAYDSDTCAETLNVKPKFGGAGDIVKVPGHDLLFARFWTTSRNPVKCRLTAVSMRERKCEQILDCPELLGVWAHGAICRSGEHGERLTVVNVRDCSGSARLNA